MMGAEQQAGWRDAAAGLIDWWVEAGVDTLVDDAPRDWLARAPAAAPPAAAPAPSPASLPATWSAFAAWRCGGEAPEAGWPGGWIAASGPETARVMVLADCPDRDDHEGDGRLLSGKAGQLFDRMLAAIGLEREAVHLAAVCAKRPIAGRLPAEAEARLAEIARHHVALVGPRVVLLLGNAASRALLATDARAARGRLHLLNHSPAQPVAGSAGGQTGVIASLHPRFLLERPSAKADAWADLRALKRAMGS